MTAHPIKKLDDTFLSSSDDASEEKIQSRFTGTPFDRLPNYESYAISAYSGRSFFGELVRILHPCSILRLLAEAKSNEDAPVVWQYGPLVEGGYASEREFVPYARRTETFLIATEGSSDVHILQHALALLRPGIADFFRFIDVSESHPFSGTGNLVKFAEGLDAYQRLSTLTLPANMRRIMLPELDTFRNFPAEGQRACTVRTSIAAPQRSKAI